MVIGFRVSRQEKGEDYDMWGPWLRAHEAQWSLGFARFKPFMGLCGLMGCWRTRC